MEIKKSLKFITPALENFVIGGNFSYLFSQLDIDDAELANIEAIDPERDDTRPLFGQSPYTINTFLNYDNIEKGYQATASFNVFGPRLSIVGARGLPDVYEQPRPDLNLSFYKRFAKNWKVGVRANNLFNPEYLMTQEFKGEEYIYERYTIGRQYSLSLAYTIEK